MSEDAPAAIKPAPNVKFEWYQTPATVAINLLRRDMKQEDISLTVDGRNVCFKVGCPEGVWEKSLELFDDVESEHTTSLNKYKYEVVFKKLRQGRDWKSLEHQAQALPASEMSTSSAVVPEYPSSSIKKKNWTELEKVAKEEEEKPEGDAALKKLFDDIYSKADEDTRRAMMKSYVESGGTVLSTNWGEVGTGYVHGKPPEGMEFAKWK